MDVSSFFARFLQPTKPPQRVKLPDDPGDFDAAWKSIQETLEHPDERQLAKGIESTNVPSHLRHIVDALVFEANHTDEDTPGACLEYFLKNDLLAQLERLCEADRPHGVKAATLKAINNLVVLLSERFLVHNAIHRPLRRLLRSCVGEEPEDRVDGAARILGAAGMQVPDRTIQGDEELEGDLVDLMCILCSRMRAYPPLLMIFFHDKGWLHPHPSIGSPIPLAATLARTMSPVPSHLTRGSDPSIRTGTKGSQNFEFLLFSYLLRFVHREGRTGDFARAGLLFLFDIAFLMPSEEGGENLVMPDEKGSDPLQDARDALGEFILDGDFADVMAAGLGAIYSLLPSKLFVPTLAEQTRSTSGLTASSSGGMHLGAEVIMQKTEEVDQLRTFSSTDPVIRGQLDLLLKLFGFLQDIILRCSSPMHQASPDMSSISNTHILGSAIADASLDALRASFLDNVLYPSILECSPTDGSSVAVLTYLDVIIGNLDDGPLLDVLLEFLMDTEDSTIFSSPVRKPKKKTGAMDFLPPMGAKSPLIGYFAEEGKFTMKDLLVDNLRSGESTATTAALKLLQTLLQEHCHFTVNGLLSTIRDPTATSLIPQPLMSVPVTSTSETQEIELYSSFVSHLDPSQPLVEHSPGYLVYLTDALASIQSDPCFLNSQLQISFLGGSNGEKVSATVHDKRNAERLCPHRLSPNDPIMGCLLSGLSAFLLRTPDENVALTGVISSLALCPSRSVRSWLTPPFHDDTFRTPDSSNPFGDSGRMNVVNQFETKKNKTELPAIYQILHSLILQINHFRETVPDFDQFLSERRQGLLFADHLDEAMNVMLDVETTGIPGFTPSPKPNSTPPTQRRPSALTSLRALLTPKKKTLKALPSTSDNRTNIPSATARQVSSSPFIGHYDQTSSVTLEAEQSQVKSGPWSPSVSKALRKSLTGPMEGGTFRELSDISWDQSTRNSIDVEREEVRKGEGEGRKGKIPLTRILDNCVVLEEFIKELVGVISARRALGVDQVGYMN
ncbi:hypothetical protein TREMEDRAFT_42491 [Tremella mesenterica DSM 1558]|uniref:uncharacterized protein n=1 Tax=Tremella mesenterica (strain ATCC 24925 / CBS 8224 / DSM 1558 / NBRC 9311 / NRRL Y-6157 / RJB 2259-6 / UBC 559-6) TaxID=578456 RepID=UPI0003F498A4|nr:uncharacterized protein TREMEDRAFT_42491 [Tremella mesenterica DSM 1558]EIW73691.1 hypothetical protein TREMEDRAFT_42491 [Tremella mesenterica DSM 1558]